MTINPEAGRRANDASDQTEQILSATPGADMTCDFPSSAAGVCEESAPAAAPAATEFISTPDAESSGTQALPSTADATSGQSSAPDLGILRSLGGYRIVRELGQGGMGAVYEAEDEKLKRHVALKVMKPEIAKNARHRERFLREARTAAKVKCDFICPIYTVGEDNGVPFIAMQLLKGESLDAPVKQGVRLPVSDVLRIGKELAQGLSVAHEAGLVHRDIKPANIWLETQRSGARRAIILDFGLARMQADDIHITQSGAIIGTPAYMSPEQARGDRAIDARTDLFSLGCVLYVLCTGELPFKSDTTMGMLMALATHDPAPPHQVAATTPKALSRLIMRLLAKKPDDRPQTAGAVMEALAEIDADPAQAVDNTVTTQLEPALAPETSAELSSPGSATAAQTRLRGAAPRKRMSVMTQVLIGLVGLGVLGCFGPLAGIGVYVVYNQYIAGGQGPGGQGPGAEAAAQEETAPPPPTGEVPAGWVVVESPRLDYRVAMPETPIPPMQNGVRVNTVQLPNGQNLTIIDQFIPRGQRGPQVLDQVAVRMLVNANAVRPGIKIPEATKLTLGPYEGRQFRSNAARISRGYVGIQMESAPGGAKITRVVPNAPADKAGLKADDIVYEAGGQQIPNPQVLGNIIQAHQMRTEMLFKVKRGQENLERKVMVTPVGQTSNYVRVYMINNHLVMMMGPADDKAPAPETAAFFNSLKLGSAGHMAATEAKLPVHEVGKGLEQRGNLNAKTFNQVYRVKLAAGTTYVIDMVAPNQNAVDPYLVLTDAAGKHLADDDDSGGNLNARIVFRPAQTGTFRIVATSFNNGAGAFTLTVRESAEAPKQEKQ